MADLINPEQQSAPIPSQLRLLTVARMCSHENYKGHELILDALAQLPAEIHWQVVGDGDQRPQLEAQVEKAWANQPSAIQWQPGTTMSSVKHLLVAVCLSCPVALHRSQWSGHR